MSRPKFIDAYCGHTSTERYVEQLENFLQCCAKCRKTSENEASKERLCEIRQELSAPCDKCRANIIPLEGAGVILGVFWNQLSVEKAKDLTLRAHHRHEHTSYDRERVELVGEGWTPKETRNITRYGDPDGPLF